MVEFSKLVVGDFSLQYIDSMLVVEKNLQMISQIRRVTSRSSNIREVKQQLFKFIHDVQLLNSTFAQKINKEMTKFQELVIKMSLYSQKSDHVINLSKLYREFSLQIERTSKVNLLSMQNIKQESINKQEEKLKAKCDKSIREFQAYMEKEKEYNHKYSIYSKNCDELTVIINRYKSYENPISFYNKILINEYLSQLEHKNHDCSTTETDIITDRQMLDQKRGFLIENVKEVSQNYFLLILNYLVTIENIIKCIVYPKNEEKLDKTELNLRSSDHIEQQHMMELQRLDNLYANQNSQKNSEDNVFEQFSQLFRKPVNQFQINSDFRFFHDRCDSIRAKKLKTSQQSFKIQSYLVNELKQQLESYQNYERDYKVIEKETFTINGIESYKKKFRKYFGSNFAEIFELCFNLIERQKKSLEKICKNMEDCEEKMRKILQNKKQSINAFDRRSKIILEEHFREKEKVFRGGSIAAEEIHQFQTNTGASFNELKKIFLELEKSEREDDKRFYINLKSLYETIMKEATCKNLKKLLEKEKNRINILNSMNSNHEILLILKDDSRYESLINQCPKPNLFSTFTSLIKKKEVDDTKILLQKKDQRLKNMIRPKQGCCGIKSQVLKLNILSQHDCKLRTDTQKYKGVLNVSSNGLIFEQSTWFSQGLQLIIPQTDINNFDVRTVKDREVVEIGTEFGPLQFESEERNQIIESMQKNIAFKGVRQNSEQGNKRNDSSSFIKNNTSTEFKLSYENTMSNSDLSKIIKSNVEKPNGNKVGGKSKGGENVLRELVKNWKEGEFFPEESFTRVVTKGEYRRDYQFHQGHSKFYLKQKREYKTVEKDLIFRYDWKISFPDSPMLHSFKHHQQVRLENISKDLRIRIVTARYYQEQLYIKNKFYKEIEQMNKRLCQFVMIMLKKDANVVTEQEYDDRKSLESYNIILDDINLEERESKFERTESALRNSRMERKSMLVPSGSKANL